MKNILCIRLHNWPIARLLRKNFASPDASANQSASPLPPAPVLGGGQEGVRSINNQQSTVRPLVLLHTLANRQLIIACSNSAARHGIKPGMTLAQARALCRDVTYADHRPDHDAKTLEALARYLIRFTPTVALETRDITESSPSSSINNQQSTIFLDLTGCEHLFHGLTPMLHQIAATLHKLRIPAFLAVAPTPAAAHALTYATSPLPKVAQQSSAAVPRPSSAARPTPQTNPVSLPQAIQGSLTTSKSQISNPKSQIITPPLDFSSLHPSSFILHPSLSSLPLTSLRLPDDILQSLHHLGLETIGQLRALPRSSLPSRFGPLLLQRLDQLTGQLPEPLIPLTLPATFSARLDFDGSVADPQALESAFQQLLSKLLLQLERRAQGIRELQITLHSDPWHILAPTGRQSSAQGAAQRNPGFTVPPHSSPERATESQTPPRRPLSSEDTNGFQTSAPASPQSTINNQQSTIDQSLTLHASRPTRNPRLLLNLYRCAHDQFLQQTSSSSSPPSLRRSVAPSLRSFSLNFDHGFTALTLSITRAEPLPYQQINLDQSAQIEQEDAWQTTLDTLRNRLGESAIEQAQLHDSYLPEKAYERIQPEIPSPSSLRRGAGRERLAPSLSSPDSPARPLELEPTPRELPVIVAPSPESDGRPLSFSLDGQLHHIAQSLGPERIAGQWWEGHTKTRDYFDIADTTGHRYWIFRVQETGKWYLHGTFQ